MITDAQFTAWLNAPESVHCMLVEADYRDANGLGTERVATHPFVSRPTDSPANTSYRARIDAIPEFKQQMSEAFIGRTTANVGEIRCINTGAIDSWLFDRDWIGYGIRMKVGDPAWPLADYRSVWTGVTADLNVTGTNRFGLVVRDMQHLLNQPVRRDAIESGTMAGQPVPVGYGTVYNARCIPIDSTGRVFRIAEGPIGSVSQVRNNGAIYGGSYTTNLDAGTITLTGSTVGELTCDYVGPTLGTLSMTNAADLIRYFATVRGYLSDDDIDHASFQRLREDVTAPLTLYLPPADSMVYEAIDQICNTIGGYTAVNRDGKLYVGRVDLSGDPVAEITPEKIVHEGLAVARLLQPVDSIRLGARQNQTTHLSPTAATESNQMLYRQSHWHMGQSYNADPTVQKTRRLGRLGGQGGTVDHHTDPSLIPTLFLNGADAAVEAERRMAVWGVRRVVFKVTCYMSALRLNLGNIVRITHPRYGLASGKNGMIVSLTERLSSRRVELGVLV